MFKIALKDFQTVLKRYPKDPDAAKKVKACEKALRQEAFLAAIVNDGNGQVVSEIDHNSIVVEESYDGPHLIDGNLTIDFVKKMIDGFKNHIVSGKYKKISLGFSDDDIKNVKAVVKFIEEELKKMYPEVQFVVYDTSDGDKKKMVIQKS
jgi:predicted RND superfamily exporter protein